MNIYINGVKCYISGVIAAPETDYEKKCIGKTPQAYVSYDMAAQIAPEAGIDGETGFTKVTCYECIIPDPVENFGLSKIKSIMKTYGDNVNIIRNDSRFAPSKRAKELKKLPNYAVRNDGIRLPWWESLAHDRVPPHLHLRGAQGTVRCPDTDADMARDTRGQII